jgi:hypothetical protein
LFQGEALAQQTPEAESEPQHFYINAGTGRSTLQAAISGSIYSLDEDTDSTSRLYIGADLSSSWSVEQSLSDLGTATFNPRNIDF